jgi:predicted HTH transcriptional regulator
MKNTQASGGFEVPRSVIAEAIINAVTHRDYNNQGFVQVVLFTDRIEVWNPGHLPAGMTLEMLRIPHGPIPRYPLIAEILFRVKYVEKAGTGTTDMIADCIDAQLPEPDFEQRGTHFVVTIWRDWLTESKIVELGLNNQQHELIALLKIQGRIGNKEYQEKFRVSKATATRHLDILCKKGILIKSGSTGKGTFYTISRKGLIKGSKGSHLY